MIWRESGATGKMWEGKSWNCETELQGLVKRIFLFYV